ncbi:universal stress protein [Streptomyces sp. RG80]|uniref:universal stress protein n=1 Tax=Streptomyces sp. RG80 TaxID=3157340 RepID=UPI00338E37B1
MERVIISGVDRSARSRVAADWAAHEALLRELPLRVAHVQAPHGPVALGRSAERPESVATHVVAQLRERHPGLKADALTLTGAPTPALREAAADAELLILGLRGEGGHAGMTLGSTAAALAARCPRPLVLVPGTHTGDGPAGRADTVTLGIDARNPAEDALGLAFTTASLHGTRLHAVHTWTLPEKEAARHPFPVLEEDRATWEDQEVQLLADALKPWRGTYPDVDVLEDVVLLDPAVALAHTSESSGLVVVGRRSGGTALALLPHTRCPVAVVPA